MSGKFTQRKNSRPAPFPLGLALHASDKRAGVLDPFLGSERQQIAAKRLNREEFFIRADISPEYCRLAETSSTGRIFQGRNTTKASKDRAASIRRVALFPSRRLTFLQAAHPRNHLAQWPALNLVPPEGTRAKLRVIRGWPGNR